MLESKIQAQIIKKLEKWGWLVNKIIHCSNPGWTDVECFRNKVAVFVEVKQPGEEPDDLQLYRHRKLQEQGFEVIVASSVSHISHLK
jgi:hypothetical protein